MDVMDPGRVAAREALTALVEGHGTVEFMVRADPLLSRRRGEQQFVCGDIWPERGGFHVKCIGWSVCCTKAPVGLAMVGMQTDRLITNYDYTICDFAFYPRVAEIRVDETVYFIRDEGGPIKIGKTRGPVESRLASLQTGNPRRLTLLATTRAYSERELHSRFWEERIAGEWFKPSRRLLAFVNGLARAS